MRVLGTLMSHSCRMSTVVDKSSWGSVHNVLCSFLLILNKLVFRLFAVHIQVNIWVCVMSITSQSWCQLLDKDKSSVYCASSINLRVLWTLTIPASTLDHAKSSHIRWYISVILPIISHKQLKNKAVGRHYLHHWSSFDFFVCKYQ